MMSMKHKNLTISKEMYDYTIAASNVKSKV